MGSPTDIRTSISSQDLLRAISVATFREFTQSDWSAFAGCESKTPLMCESVAISGAFHTIVADGEVVNVIRHGDMYGGQLFRIVDMDQLLRVTTSDQKPRSTLLEEAITDDTESIDALLRTYRSQAAEIGLTIPDHVRIKKVVLAERDYIWE